MADWDSSYDLVIVGSGGAGFAAAMAAADSGLTPLIVESTDKWGGSTAMSGGGLWLPTNPLMARDGVGDSREEALAYMETTIGDVGRSTSRERKEAFVDSIADLVTTAEKHGMVFARATDYPDYYPELTGGKIGRSIELEPFDAKRIGDAWATSRGQEGVPYPIMTDDVWLLTRAWSTPAGFVRGAKFVFRALGGAVRGRHVVGAGAALISGFYEAVVLRQGVPLWLDAPLTDLVVDDGRVTGAVLTRGGREVRVEARRGVVLASGGFEGNVDWREKYHGVPGWPSGNPGNLGGPIDIAQQHGAVLELMDDAWWGASVPSPEPGGRGGFIVGERSMPFSIIVDGQGRRFANESASYVDLGHEMLARRDEAGDNFWMISDVRHSRRYLRTYALDPKLSKGLAAKGWLHKADNLVELARATGIEPAVLRETIQRFNGFARSGVDGDFGRGNSAYDRYYSDPLVHPNPNLGPIENGPFTAVKLVPGDLGTKGGVVTDADARALREDGSVIEGLYAAGNASASVMGHTYPGPGSTIGPATVFGLRAGRHAAAHG